MGVVTWGVVTQNVGDPSPDSSAAQAPAEQISSEDDGARTRGQTAATNWAKHTSQLVSLLEGYPQVTVHRLRSYAAGTLRLECTMPSKTLRDVGRLRTATANHAIANGSSVKLSEVQIQRHGTCDIHGEVREIMAFYLDVTPAEPTATTVGMLQLVPRCSTK
jgi:hypothetical protein